MNDPTAIQKLIHEHRAIWFSPSRATSGRAWIVAVRMLILLLSSAVHEASAEFREETITGHEGAATDIKADQRYDSGVRVRDPALGISFVIPEEWRGGASPSSNLFFLIPDAKRGGIGLVVMFDQTTPQELADHMNEPQVLEEGFILHPTTSAAVSGDRITASYHA
ncbi:MAG: hypothetical protein ACREJU_19525, partial [Nitrospiraceae bacterium]